MYAFVLHAHQKIDRAAWRGLLELAPAPATFPNIKEILHFEGANGPDAPKFKKHGEQPWHFVDPFNRDDTALDAIIDEHYHALVKALKKSDRVSTSFEAAWLAHAIVDGLTPAHHYPYEEKLEDVRGEDRRSRKTLTSRAIVKGETTGDSIRRSFKIVGPKGLLTTHAMFEAGAYMAIAPSRISKGTPSAAQAADMLRLGVVTYFRRTAREIADLDMYGRFYQTGWTPTLARETRHELVPRMVMCVTLAWYGALVEAGLVEQRGGTQQFSNAKPQRNRTARKASNPKNHDAQHVSIRAARAAAKTWTTS